MASALGTDVNTIAKASDLTINAATNDNTGGSAFGASLLGAALIVFIAEAILALAFSTYR